MPQLNTPNINPNLFAQAPTGIMQNLSPTEQAYTITIRTNYSEQNIMAKKSALQKIEAHEKLCRIMQNKPCEQIKEIKERVSRMEKMIMGGGGAIILALLMNAIQ